MEKYLHCTLKKKKKKVFTQKLLVKSTKKCDNFDTYVLWTAEAQLFFLTLCFYQRKTMIEKAFFKWEEQMNSAWTLLFPAVSL